MAGETATAADGMHPTGMHSCSSVNLDADSKSALEIKKFIISMPFGVRVPSFYIYMHTRQIR